MKHHPLQLKIIEDNPDDAELITRKMRDDGFVFNWKIVDNKETFHSALADPPDLMLSGFSLLSFNAFDSVEICREMIVISFASLFLPGISLAWRGRLEIRFELKSRVLIEIFLP